MLLCFLLNLLFVSFRCFTKGVFVPLFVLVGILVTRVVTVMVQMIHLELTHHNGTS